MTVFTGVAIYFTIWWTVLFSILPLGVTSHAEAGIDHGDGGDPGAPVDPKLKRKFLTTTIIASVLWVILFLVLKFELIQLPDVPRSWR
jgi:predicted secreted protein